MKLCNVAVMSICNGRNINKSSKRSGFTLIEVMVVILLIGLLFVFLVPKIASSSTKAKEAGVKTDFHEFQVAAEQLVTENSGVNGIYSESQLVSVLNNYLDDALKFGESAESNKADPWNNKYTVQFVKDSNSSNDSNGAIIFCSGGRNGILDGDSSGENDDYILSVVYENGSAYTATLGASSEIGGTKFESADITPSGVASSYTESTNDSDMKVVYWANKGEGTDADYFKWDNTHTIIEGFSSECPDEAKVHLVIPEGCVEIGWCAFSKHSEIKSVQFSSSIEKIDYEAFAGTGVSSVIIPGNIQYMASGTFRNCASLKNVVIQPGKLGYVECAFPQSIESVVIPGTAIGIRDDAFKGCSNLKSVTIGDGVKYIGESAFKGCTSLTKVKVPGTVAELKCMEFSGCTSLKDVTLGDGITSVSGSAFGWCTSLESITLPDSVTDVSGGPFVDCTSLKSISAPLALKDIEQSYGRTSEDALRGRNYAVVTWR